MCTGFPTGPWDAMDQEGDASSAPRYGHEPAMSSVANWVFTAASKRDSRVMERTLLYHPILASLCSSVLPPCASTGLEQATLSGHHAILSQINRNASIAFN